MSKGSNSTVTNVQALPPAVELALTQAYTDFNPFSSAFDAVSSFDPTASKVGTAALSTGEQNAITAANNLLANQPAFLGTAQQNLGGLMDGAIDTTALANQLGLTADTSNLQNLLGATTDTSGILNAANQRINTQDIARAANAQTGLQGVLDAAQRATDASNIVAAGNRTVDTSGLQNIAGQQNAATDLLTGLASGGTNPFLQQQIDDAIGGAVDRVSSQYALGGRLGSDSFADALGAGITGAAAPILSQNLQQDRANQLAAAQALGQVSGQDIGRQLTGAEIGVNQQQADINRALQAAQSAAGIEQADLARGLTGVTSAAGLQQSDLARALQGATAVSDVDRVNIANALQGATTAAQLGQQDLGQQANIAQSLLGAQQTDLGRDATLANQLTAASEADARARLAAIGAAPGLLGADQALISQAAQLGGLARGVDQAALDATAAQANQQNILDQNQINALLSAAGMGGGLFGQTETQTGGGASALSSGLGGALTGASLGNALGPALAGSTLGSTLGITAANAGGLGAALGAGLGLLSDKRLKKDIKQIGTHANGLAMYSWQWNDEAQSRGFDIYPTEGFMAQEANELYPQHVYVHPSGYLMLDYASLSNEAMGAA